MLKNRINYYEYHTPRDYYGFCDSSIHISVYPIDKTFPEFRRDCFLEYDEQDYYEYKKMDSATRCSEYMKVRKNGNTKKNNIYLHKYIRKNKKITFNNILKYLQDTHTYNKNIKFTFTNAKFIYCYDGIWGIVASDGINYYNIHRSKY